MTDNLEKKEKELVDVKESLKKVEDFLLERREKDELKRALSESVVITAAAGIEIAEGESSQPAKRWRLVKLADKKQHLIEEELEALHEEAFVAISR